MKTNAKPNLGGTISTLDEVNGSVPLGDGILSKEGIAVLDDSQSFLLVDDWIAPRRDNVKDIYVFSYGVSILFYFHFLNLICSLTTPSATTWKP